MQPQPDVPWWTQLLPFVIVLILVVVRFVRPQRISVTRMWVQPIILVAIAAFAVYGSATLNPAPAWEIAAGMAIGLVAGVPFGVLRGMHTDVRPTDKPGVMYLGSSWITMTIFLIAFGFRSVIRFVAPHRGSLASVIGDALLAFAVGFIVTSYIFIYRKYEEEVAGKIAAPPAPLA